MHGIQQRLANELRARKQKGLLRLLRPSITGIDFCSNDYLGFARNPLLSDRLTALVKSEPNSVLGAKGSRLISGDMPAILKAEEFIAEKHGVQNAMLMPSGYLANQALFSSLPKRGDTILIDERVHRSVYDGCRLSQATRWKFRHNDLQHLQELLRRCHGQVWIGVESLYSMDGDFAPLAPLVALAEKYDAALIVDEAHAIGAFGLGLVNQQKLQQKVFASVVTYGKAMGCWGAAILGSRTLIDYLVNYAAPLIYSTGIPAFHALAIQEIYGFLDQCGATAARELQEVVSNFNALGIPSQAALQSPIKPIRFKNNITLQAAAKALKENQIAGYAIKSPTVALGMERIRISLHSFNCPAEIALLGSILKEYLYE